MSKFVVKRFFKRILGVITFRKWRMNTLHFWCVKRKSKYFKRHDSFYTPIYKKVNYRGPVYYVMNFCQHMEYLTLRLIGKISK